MHQFVERTGEEDLPGLMFGAIVASRPVLTNLQTISQTQFAFTIPAEPAFSHIVVFLLPGGTLPDGTAAAVYIRLPPSQDFKLLGAVANDKQSAIFKFRSGIATGETRQSAVDAGDDVMIDDVSEFSTIQPVPRADIVVGISIEPATNIQAQLEASRTQSTATSSSGMELVRHQPQATSGVSTRLLAQRIIKNAFNFLSSFAGGSGGNEVVPLKSFQDWWTKFEKRIELDPGFLERDQD